MSARKIKSTERLGSGSAHELLLCLASGGMGTVFLGRRKGSTEVVAIKRAHAHLLDDPAFRKMFVAEAALASRIHHPNAIGVVAVDESDGELLMIMRYVRGGSLSDLLSENHALGRRLPTAVALRIVIDVARGLHAAHELHDETNRPLGIIHRDVSPQNILVGVDGVAAIVDFGVAKAAMLESTRSASDILKGKLAYMAPEYLQRRQASVRSDVFSLGVVTWEALANARLFRGEDEVDTMQRILDQTPAPFLSDLIGLDPGVAAIVARAVAKDPAKRFTTAAEFADALEAKARVAELLGGHAEVGAIATQILTEELILRDRLLAEAVAARDVDAGGGAVDRFTAPFAPAHVNMFASQLAPQIHSPPAVIGAADIRTIDDALKRRSVQLLIVVPIVLFILSIAIPLVRSLIISGGYDLDSPTPTSARDEDVGVERAKPTAKDDARASGSRQSAKGRPIDIAALLKRLEGGGYVISNRNDIGPTGEVAKGTDELKRVTIAVTRGDCVGLVWITLSCGEDEAEMLIENDNDAMTSRRLASGVVQASVHFMSVGKSSECTDERVLDVATSQ